MNKQNDTYVSAVQTLIGQTVKGKVKTGQPIEPVVIKEALGLNRYIVVTKAFEEVIGSFEKNIFVSDEVAEFETGITISVSVGEKIRGKIEPQKPAEVVTIVQSYGGDRYMIVAADGHKVAGILKGRLFISDEVAEFEADLSVDSDLIGKNIMGKLDNTGNIYPVHILKRNGGLQYTVLYNDVQWIGTIENMFFIADGVKIQEPVSKKVPFESGVTIIIKTRFFGDVVAKAKRLKEKVKTLKGLVGVETKNHADPFKAMVQTKQSGDGSRLTINIDGRALAILLEKSFEIVGTYLETLLTVARLGIFKLLEEQVKDCAHDLEARIKELKD